MKIWVSSPNMSFIPDVPTHRADEWFGFYVDGMLGVYEHTKWPQIHDADEPHAIAVPGNPLLLSQSIYNPTAVTSLGGMDPWQDEGAAWFSFTSANWVRVLDIPNDEVGVVDGAVCDRLLAAAREATQRSLALCQVDYGLSPEHIPERYFVWRLIVSLGNAITKVRNVGMPLGETIQWFREAQRILLELRGWYTYMTIVRPRIEHMDDNYGDVLALRGVITGKLSTVETMYRAGVPVWYVRDHT
ncbi:hypothetical protein BV25DRAFT_1807272, partial [Artomyces pyxidatus]